MRNIAQRAATACLGQQLSDVYEDALLSKGLVGAALKIQERWNDTEELERRRWGGGESLL